MARAFSSRLFFYFASFAIVPTLLIAIVGYYLTLDAGSQSMVNGADSPTVEQYHDQLLFGKLHRSATTWRPGDSSSALADFAVTLRGETVLVVWQQDPLIHEFLTVLLQAVRVRPKGFAAIGDRYCQYVSCKMGDGDTLILGVIHTRAFSTLLESHEAERRKEIGHRELWSRYLVFLGGIFVCLSIATVIAAGLISRRTARQIARPIEELSIGAGRIASGDFGHEIPSPEHGDREIRALVASFNRMSRRLDDMTARLAQAERVAAWRQIARRFAHELKNPLQPILISLYRIEQMSADLELQKNIVEPLRAATEEVRHLQQLADRFSLLSKLPSPELKEVDMCGLVKSVAQVQSAQLKGYLFTLEVPELNVAASVDEGFVREALHNLLQNAIDATELGGSIVMTLYEDQDHVAIIVQDTGTGMDEKTLADSRLPYFTTKEKGNGLGLAIVERSMNEMGGRLTVQSSPGVGTTVTLSFSRLNDGT